MKKIFYVAFSSIPSSLPSSLQIIKTCEKLSKLSHDVTLVKPGTGNKKISIKKYYGIKDNIKVKQFSSINNFPQGLNFYLYCFYCLYFISKEKQSITITRNYFMCYLLLLFKIETILEIHSDTNIEGRLTKFILRYFNFFNNNNLKKIVAISNAVKNLFIKKYHVKEKKILVLPSGSSIRVRKLPNFCFKKKLKIGYFGSSSFSKGIQTIISLSKIDSKNEYFIYGGENKDLRKLRLKNTNKNLFFKKSIPYTMVPKKMMEMDILTLPYTKVIKSAGEVDDISSYTSPLKLFDYLAVGKIIVSSNLKVLREIINEKNAYFINNYENIFEWKKAINIIQNNKVKNFILSSNNYKLSKKYDHETRVKYYI
jgi:glycosyltransferase involved in cell wall biosynthesis